MKTATSNLDPKNIHSRLYNQVSELLGQLEKDSEITINQRYMSLVAIGRILTIFQNLRLKEAKDEPTAGSAVRKYSTAFTAHDTRRRKAVARAAAAEEPDDIDLDDFGGDERDPAA